MIVFEICYKKVGDRVLTCGFFFFFAWISENKHLTAFTSHFFLVLRRKVFLKIQLLGSLI